MAHVRINKTQIILNKYYKLNLCKFNFKYYHFESKFTPQTHKNLETFWKKKFANESYYKHYLSIQDINGYSKKYSYVLSMFPYPSGALHMGHVRVYTISDMMARYTRMYSKSKTIHPMGWDAFGLPAENAAKLRNLDPELWTKKNIMAMRSQLEDLGCYFDWDREISTCDPQYYKWTQFLFLKLFDAGLVYQKMGRVNWDPVDKTVLADEQIDSEGHSWRSGAKVEHKFLKQWYIKTTAFSKSLLDGLNEVNSDLWKDVIELQRNWIGTCNGMQFNFQIQNNEEFLTIFTLFPKYISCATHILISKNNFLNQSKYFKPNVNENDQFYELNVVAINPFNQKILKIFYHKNFNFGEFRDAHLGIPEMSEMDFKFAQENGIQIPKNISTIDDNLLQKFGYVASEKSRDWCISRQRYWGTPIPIIHCQNYGALPVIYSDLPVSLPKVNNFMSSVEGRSPLSQCTDWLKSKCYKCNCDGYGVRESDTMDTFVDSSWYFLRYLDPSNQNAPFDLNIANQAMPVDLYIGGKEHATMHLYYARFICHFLHSIGFLKSREPFVNLLTQGMVLGKSYKEKDSGKYLKFEDIQISGDNFISRSTGQQVVAEWEKMSKSKFNGVDPQMVIDKYGSDSTRLAILSNVAPKSDRLWSNDIFVGVLKWQSRIWSLVADFISSDVISNDDYVDTNIELENHLNEIRNRSLLLINHHLQNTFLFNTAISQMQILTSHLKKVRKEEMGRSKSFQQCLFDLIILLFPFTPYFSSHLWTAIATSKSSKVANLFYFDQPVFAQPWPVTNSTYKPMLIVKIDGKDAFEIRLPMTYDQTTSLLTEDLAWRLVQNHIRFHGNHEVDSFSSHNLNSVLSDIKSQTMEIDTNLIAQNDLQSIKYLLDLIQHNNIIDKQLVLYGNSKAMYLIKSKKKIKKSIL